MTTPRLPEDRAHYWRSPLMPGGDLVTAHYHSQVFVPHWHDHFVIPIIETGAQSYLYGGQQLVAGPLGMAIINPGEVHTAQRATHSGWSYRAFYPSIAFMQSQMQSMCEKAHCVPWFRKETIHDPAVAGGLLQAHRLLQEQCGQEHGGDVLAAQTALVGAFSALLLRHAGVQPDRVPPSDACRVERMQAVLAEDISMPLSLEELGRMVGLSAFHAARLFTRQVGLAPHAWRNQLRLNRALELLRRDQPVADVAVACGFTDQSHFTRHFKRAYGVAPGAWKNA